MSSTSTTWVADTNTDASPSSATWVIDTNSDASQYLLHHG